MFRKKYFKTWAAHRQHAGQKASDSFPVLDNPLGISRGPRAQGPSPLYTGASVENNWGGGGVGGGRQHPARSQANGAGHRLSPCPSTALFSGSFGLSWVACFALQIFPIGHNWFSSHSRYSCIPFPAITNHEATPPPKCMCLRGGGPGGS